MNQEEKQLLLKDLCARLSYGVIVGVKYNKEHGSSDRLRICNEGYLVLNTDVLGLYIQDEIYLKPYLRPMSTMTESEMDELRGLCGGIVWKKDILRDEVLDIYYRHDALDWLLKHHFDTRGLIAMGLALEAPKGMYNEMLNI